jgi:phosphomannomutase
MGHSVSSNIYVFDVDNTLTPTRERMNEEFRKFFLSFCTFNKVYIVTGSDLAQTYEQVGKEIVDAVEGVFSCCGNEFWHKGRLVYKNKLQLTFHEVDILESLLRTSLFPTRTGRHIEERSGMVNFSIVGRKANKVQRQQYIDWDYKTQERERLASKIRQLLPRLDAAIAGETGIDVYAKGNDKGQVYPFIVEDDKQIIFFGDRCEEGGNDYPLAMISDVYYHVLHWQDTKHILEEVYHEHC